MTSADMLVIVLLCCVSLSVIAAVALWLYLRNTGRLPILGGTRAIPLSRAGVSGRVPPLVMWEGRQAYKVTYRGGQIHGGATNCSMIFKPPVVFPCARLRVSFKLWFADNFPWEAAANRKVGGKLGGLFIGSGSASGGDYSTTGASYRLVFHEGGSCNGYLYPQLRKTIVNGQPSWGDLDQSPALQGVSTIAAGVHVWRRNTTLKFKKGQWNDVEMYCVLNSPGKRDGVMQLTVNGARLMLDTVRYRHTADTLISSFKLGTFFGGGDKSYAPPADTSVWFADYKFQKLG